MTKYDVMMVGAGPGGCLAAKTVAEKGLKTLVIERGREIGVRSTPGVDCSLKCLEIFLLRKK